jgi:hypothetical protein
LFVRPIVAQVNLHVDDRAFYAPAKHGHFRTRFHTFNAPMNVSIVHSPTSRPSLLGVDAKNTQGIIDITLDPLYTGTFDVRTRGAKTLVHETAASGAAAMSRIEDNFEEHKVHFDHNLTEWTRGWVGDHRRPEEFDRYSLGRVELANSLSPVNLHLARLRPSSKANAARR